MRYPVRLVGITLAGLAAACTLGIGHGLAQQQTTLTKMSGTTVGSGSWTRTITDVTEPNGPNGEKVLATYNVEVPWIAGLSADSMAARYRKAALATLPPPPTGANGYGAVPHNLVRPTIRVSKQAGTYNFGDATPPTGITMTTSPPLSAEDAPIASPAGLVSLAAALSAVAAWHRRRRGSA